MINIPLQNKGQRSEYSIKNTGTTRKPYQTSNSYLTKKGKSQRLLKETEMDFNCEDGYLSLHPSPSPPRKHLSNRKYQNNAETLFSGNFR